MGNGLAPDLFIDEVLRSEEAALQRSAKANMEADEPGIGLSDGEFLVRAAGLLFGRGLLPAEVAAWQRRIEYVPTGRTRLMTELVSQYIGRQEVPQAKIAHPCVVLGTNRTLTRREWDDRQSVLPTGHARSVVPTLPDRPFLHTGLFKVSMIASLYKAGLFIEDFLKNITAQTAFCESELIIIDAASPDREFEIIQHYQAAYPNIVYKRIGFRIGIYDAWNIGLELARGLYITNTNVDDLRRSDSIALQAAVLDQDLDADIVYQDFFYSFDPQLSFEEVAAIGFKSELPIVTRHNLLGCNSPHNAPMWRKQLHRDLGLFDTNYKSAGDHEFWLRCLAAGRIFRKINTPHIVYFQNPEGMSTKPDSPGVLESYGVFKRYSEKLTSPVLLQSRSAFAAQIGLSYAAPCGDTRDYYDVAQDALVRLGKARLSSPACDTPSSVGDANRILRILVDGIGFQTGDGEAFRALQTILGDVPAPNHVVVFILDRGFCPDIEGFHRIDFPSCYGSYTAADSLLIQQICDKFEIDVFTSTGFTTAATTPQIHLVTDLFSTSAAFGHPARERKERDLAVAYATRFACVSSAAVASLLASCPDIHPSRITPLFAPVSPEASHSTGRQRGHEIFVVRQAEGARLRDVWQQVQSESSAAGASTFVANWLRIRSLQAEVDVGVD